MQRSKKLLVLFLTILVLLIAGTVSYMYLIDIDQEPVPVPVSVQQSDENLGSPLSEQEIKDRLETLRGVDAVQPNSASNSETFNRLKTTKENSGAVELDADVVKARLDAVMNHSN